MQKVTQREQLSQAPLTAARTPVRLQVPVRDWSSWLGHHYPPKVSRPGMDCTLSRECAPTHYRAVSDAHNQSLTPIITRGGQRNVHEGPS